MHRFLVLAPILALLLVAGCSSGPAAIEREVDVALGRDVTYGGDVELVAIPRRQWPLWSELDLDAYWRGEAGQDLREEALADGRLLEKNFRVGVRREVLSASDPIWQRWKAQGVDVLVALTNLPPSLGEAQRPGVQDPRRRAFELDPDQAGAAGGRITLRATLDGFEVTSR